jgi:hypothetical protein
MYDPDCLSTTKKAWLDIEETLLDNPGQEQAVECLKRVRRLLVQCIREEDRPGPRQANRDLPSEGQPSP